MFTVSCDSCGTGMQMDESAVPPSGIVKKCPKCGHNVTVMPPAAGGIGQELDLDGFMPMSTPLPKSPAQPPPLPMAKGPAVAAFDQELDVVDLPVPKGPTSSRAAAGDDADAPDLLAPVGPTPKKTQMGMAVGDEPDLLAPVGPKGKSAALDQLTPAIDLLTPVGPTSRKNAGAADLPAPVGPVPTKNVPDLLTPVGPTSKKNAGADLPAPVGPVPTKNVPDLLTPVGPAPVKNAPDLLTPVGPAPVKNAPDLLTPVGPAPVKNAPDLPAPKGFFDDVPQAKGPSAGGGSSPGLSLDDLDLAPAGPGASPPPMPGAGPPRVTSAIPALDLSTPPAAAGDGGISLDGLDLAPSGDGGKSGPKGSTAPMLDLGNAGTGDPSVISFAKPSGSSTMPPPMAPSMPRGGGGGGAGALDLADPPPGAVAKKAAGTIAEELPAAGAAGVEGKAGRGAKAKAEVDPAARRRRTIVAGVLALLVAGGGAGFYLKQRMDKAEAMKRTIGNGLVEARKLLTSDEPGHWEKAHAAAVKVLRTDKKNGDALGLGAQAMLAAIIDEGHDVESRRKTADELLNQAVEFAVSSEEVDKARALASLIDGKTADAIAELSKLSKKSRGDANLPLYLGWAQLGAGDAKAARASFEAAVSRAKDRVPALFGLGQAQLALADYEAAKASFEKVMEKRTNHVGAWVGLASMLPRDRVGTREKRFMEIVSSAHAKDAHPRDLSAAWAMAGWEALRGRRLGEAGERFKRAEELDPDNVDAMVGRGLSALSRGNLNEAHVSLEDAHQRRPDNVPALLALTQLALREEKLEQARDYIGKARALREEDADVQLWVGKVAEADPSGADLLAAEEAYKKAIKLDPSSYEPVVALAQLYQTRLKKPELATQTLAVLAADAKNDAYLANTLGLAYLSAGDRVKAKEWFQAALKVEPQNADAHVNLGTVLEAEGDFAGAIAEYEAARKIDVEREDVALKLAGAYEGQKRFEDAERIYLALLDESGGRKPTIPARAAAGRFYARRGDMKRAGEMGRLIGIEDPRHSAGLFLRGVAALAEGRNDDAQKLIQEAAVFDPQPQYFEALGRAFEADSMLDDAIAHYTSAIKRDAKYVAPLIGRARVRQLRREWAESLPDLEAAKALEPEHAVIYFMLGRANYEMGNKKEALKPLEEAVAREPKHAEAYYRLGTTYYDLDRPGEAARHLRRAADLAEAEGTKPNWLPDALYRLAFSYRALRQKGEECATYKRYLGVAAPTEAGRSDIERNIISCP